MSSAREHHARAEQLLEEARTTQDQISHRLILAEAQVHATLALSAPGGTGPPGPGQSETGYATHAFGQFSGYYDDGWGSRGETAPGLRDRPGRDPNRPRAEESPAGAPPTTPPVPASQYDAEPSPPDPARPAYPRRRAEERPQEQEQEPEPEEQEPGSAVKGPVQGDPPGNRDPAA